MYENTNFLNNHLPDELTIYCLSFLDRKTLCKVSSVNKDAKRLAEDDFLWRIFVSRDLTSHPRKNYKQYYKSIHQNIIIKSKEPNNKIEDGKFNNLPPLVAAAKEGLEQLVKRFLKEGATLGHGLAPLVTLLLDAAGSQIDEDLSKILPSKSCLTTSELAKALSASIQTQDKKLIKLVLEHGGKNLLTMNIQQYKKLTGHWYTPLLEAAFDKKWASALFLLEKLANPCDALPFDGWRALHFAARECEAEVVKSLLDKGAKRFINEKTINNNLTAIELAAECKSKEKLIDTVNLLLENGAEIGSSYDKVTEEYGLEFAKKLFPTRHQNNEATEFCRIF